MKSKSPGKKLKINKKTIANLCNTQLFNIKGGEVDATDLRLTCETCKTCDTLNRYTCVTCETCNATCPPQSCLYTC
jgi:hypothetical protein